MADRETGSVIDEAWRRAAEKALDGRHISALASRTRDDIVVELTPPRVEQPVAASV